MQKKLLLLSFLMVGALADTLAQHYQLGFNPSRLRWQQINTDKVQVLFPEGLEEQGQRVANLVHFLHDHELETIGKKREKIPIILQNQNTQSNGFVALGPFRSEFFMTPPQFNFLGTGDWLDLLTIHEYRHVLQTSNARRGVTNVFSRVLGDNTLALFRRTALPRWYLEGDAIIAETIYSTSGRGRLPAFDMEYRALRLGVEPEGPSYKPIHFNYEKAGAGSLKDFVPSHYPLGYYMTTHARREYGSEIWEQVLTDAVQYKGLLFPFSRNLKKHTGLRTPQLYRETMSTLDSTWLAERALTPIDTDQGSLLTSHRKRTFTIYSNPHYLQNGTLVAEKVSFKEIRAMVALNPETGEERKLTLPGLTFSPSRPISVRAGRILWDEAQFHPRWGYSNYSILKTAYLLGTEPGQTLRLVNEQQLSYRSRFFAPSLSWAGDRVAVVEVPEQLNYSLVILDAQTGNELIKLPNPDNYFFSFPNWLEDDSQLVAVAQHNHQQALVLIDPASGNINTLLPFSNDQLLNPFHKGDYIYFSGAHTGINNIFAYHLPSGDLFQVTFSLLGAFQPSVHPEGTKLAYTEYSRMGYMVKELSLDPAKFRKVVPGETENVISFYKPMLEESGGSILDEVGDDKFPVSRFRKARGLFNPHSIQPFVNHPNYNVEIVSRDNLSTLQSSLGYTWNANERTGGLYGRFNYAEFFPVIEAGFDAFSQRRRLAPFLNEAVSETDTALFRSFYTREWVEQDYFIGTRIPLNITRGNHYTVLEFSGKYHFRHLTYTPTQLQFSDIEQQRNGWLHAAEMEVRFSRLQNRAVQHLNPRFGQVFHLRYQRTMPHETSQGEVFRALGVLLFPGVSANHSLMLRGAYQQELLTNTYMFRDSFFYPRGYPGLIHDRVGSLAINYALPLLYPDLPVLGPLAFLQRIKANFFFDIARTTLDPMNVRDIPNNTRFTNLRGSFQGFNEIYRSVGVELSFDFRAARLIEMSIGARYAYLLDTQNLSSFRLNPHQIDFIVFNLGGY